MANTPISNMTATWDNGGTTFNAIRMNVTDTASDAASLLYSLQIGGAHRYSVAKDGSVNIASGAGYNINAVEVLAALSCNVTVSGVVTTGTIELGHASDTTLSRSAAGTIAVQGIDLATVDDVEVSIINVQTGTAYTLAMIDRGQTVTMDNAAANTVTIPTNVTVGFDTGTVINIVMLGAGGTSITGDTGVTVNGVSAGTKTIQSQYQGASILKVAVNTWIVSGDV